MRNKVVTIALMTAVIFSNAIFNREVVASSLYPQPEKEVSIDVFYQSLEPYGDWFSLDRYGWVWMPYDASVSWRPYSVGQWVYSDYGWTWDSDEPWGWATYHYGRWDFDANYGWIWIPGTVWGPAWVSWRLGARYFGWAPLPPVVGWNDGLVLGGLDLDEYIPPFWYNFCEEQFFGSRHIRDHIVLPARNVTLVNDTRNITRYEVNNNRVIDRSVDVGRIEKDTGQSIKRYRVVDADSPTALRQARVNDGEIALYKPDVLKPTEGHAPRPPSSSRQSQLSNQNNADGGLTRGEDGRAGNAIKQPNKQPNKATSDVIDQQKDEHRMLEQQQKAEREALNQVHRQELSNPPAGVSRDDLSTRHNAEQRALDEQSRRETQLLNNRHSMGRTGAVAPGGRRH